ncbi:MAG: geranylgeranyl reductase family protein [Anaerolineae bacterium]
MDFDVIVAGAGAGGAAAAYHLGQAGLKTLVVDKAHLPRYKACGGAIPRAALDRFPFAFDGVVEAAPSEAHFLLGRLPGVRFPLPDRPVVMVMRERFDAFLLAQSGAEVVEGQAVTGVVEADDRVEVRLGDRTLTARYLVGADGATSQVARWLGLRHRRRLGGTLEAEVPLEGDARLADRYGRRAIFIMGAMPWGYGWVFPKGDHLSVGIGRLRPGRADLRAALQREMDRLGIPLDGVPIRGHPLPSYRPRPWPFWQARWRDRISTRRCLLVGDAANLVDPLLGEGIRYALESGRLAAAAIAADDVSGYEAAVWQRMGQSLATASLVAQWYYHLPWLCFILGLQNPAVIGLFVSILSDRMSYEGIGRRIVASTLLWVLRGFPIK